ncbi:MAG: MGMT family protein [Chloroflexi bacterium]|nr:MGMT family protein [Chloroflexota bacterium]
MGGEPPFARRVLDLVRQVPAGRVVSYGQVADLLGAPGRAREVGWALAGNRDPAIPCHRVVNRRGELSGGHAFGHPMVQRALLEDEGVAFDGDGRIDLARFRWEPD